MILLLMAQNIAIRFLLFKLGKLNSRFRVNLDAFEHFGIKQARLLQLFLHAPVNFLLFLDRSLYSLGWFTCLSLPQTPLIVQVVIVPDRGR